MAEEQVVLEGFLEKKGEKGVIKGYKKREFKLFKTGQLRYYDKDQEMGFILMDTVKSVESVDEEGEGRDFTIEIPSRTYYLRAADNDEMMYWVGGLNKFLKKKETVGKKAKKGVQKASSTAKAAGAATTAAALDAKTKAERIAKYGAPLSDEEVEKEEKRRAKAKKLKEKEDARHSKEKTKMKEAEKREAEKRKAAKEKIKQKTAKK